MSSKAWPLRVRTATNRPKLTVFYLCLILAAGLLAALEMSRHPAKAPVVMFMLLLFLACGTARLAPGRFRAGVGGSVNRPDLADDAVSFVPMHGSAMTYATWRPLLGSISSDCWRTLRTKGEAARQQQAHHNEIGRAHV